MKFLIAATLMCLALVGQSQAGSLRGLAVQVPHQSYGVPVLDNEIHIEETQPIVEDKDSVSVDLETHEEPIVSQPSSEYGAPAVAYEIETVPFVDSLPLVDSIVSFGTPSETYGPPAEPTTPKPELPYLEPGLPTLPEAPVVPEVPEVGEDYVEVSNEYLPPTDEAPLVVPEGKPSEVYGPPAAAEVVLPTIHEIPALPEAPAIATPAVTVENSGQYFYEPPAIGFPTPISHIPELPAAPVTSFAAENARPTQIYGLSAEVPEYIAPAVTKDQTVPVEAPKQYFYEPSAFPTPVSVQPILPEIKTLPAEAPRQYFYEVPAKPFPTPVTLPVRHEIVSHSGFVQSSASSSSSSSSLHVNKYAVPLIIQPQADSVIIEEVKPIGQRFAIHSVAGSSENTSTGLYKQVSVVSHLMPHLSSIGTIVGHHQPVASSVPVPVPHGAYGVANF